MKTDRELLELAAKAVGGVLSQGTAKRRVGDTWDEWEWVGDIGIGMPNGITEYPQHSGEAMLMLMHKLRLSVLLDDECVTVCNEFGDLLSSVAGDGMPVTKQDIRDCVLFAAAEIGEAME